MTGIWKIYTGYVIFPNRPKADLIFLFCIGISAFIRMKRQMA